MLSLEINASGGSDVMEKVTKAQFIYGALMEDIAGGRLQPGVALDEVQMARAYGVSRTPIREAIRRLEITGLVEARSHRGAVVTGLSEQQLDDMFAVMAELEGLCAKWSALAMTGSERKSLRVLHEAMAPAAHGDDRVAYVEANTRFHKAVYAGAHNPFLAELVGSARRRVAPFRRAQFETPGRLVKSYGEHGLIASAIERGDADAAYAAMRAHIVVVRSAVDDVTEPVAFTAEED